MPIHIACLEGHLNVVKYLITQQRCDPNVKGANGRTLFHNACVEGHMDIIRYLITEQGCDPVIKDNNGDMPIHIASLGAGHLNVVKYLITEQQCDPNVKGKFGRTTLHNACDKGHMDIIRYLITEQGCDPAVEDNNGNMPIHIACRGGHLNVVEHLITEQRCDPNVKGNFGQTTLHKACDKGHMDIIRYLITEQGCDPAVEDNNGNMPIHIACLSGHLNVVKYLITEQRCDPNVKGAFGRTTLYKACDKGHIDIIRYLFTEQDCDPAVEANNGDMPIHIACLSGHLNVVKYLIAEQRCDPNVKGEIGWTTLHDACSKGHMDIIRYLITEQGCDPAVEANNGDMPIHIASFRGHLNVVKYLITEQRCDPNIKGARGNTALHYVCGSGHIDIIQYLISEQGSNPAITNDMFQTPLHIACNHGHVDVVQLLLQDRRVDALSIDKFGKSPADYVHFSNNSYQLLKLFKPLLKSREDFPIHLFTKVVLTGNSGAGKSSLAKVIAEQDTVNFSHKSDTDFARKSIHYRIESEVETLTAGIDSYIVKSETIGNFMLYDLAGQSEYYFSQSVIMETVIQKMPAIFIDLVDLSKSEEEIAQAIHHWLTFIESTTSKTQEKSCVMIVGSHTDLLTEQQVITKTTLVKDLVDRRVKMQRYEGFVGMDCRVVTDKITNEFFPYLLNFHTTISSYSQPVSVYCHELYAFLQTKLEKTACQLHELISFLTAEENSLVPSDVPILSELLEDLSGRGVIIYLKNEQCLEKSWVVVKREIILKHVNGELFKPKYFKGCNPIASSTGIIRMSSLAELFPQYDPEMLVELMVRLEFCHPVNLSKINTNLQPLEGVSTSKKMKDIFLFFPSLLQAERPQALITKDRLSKQDRFGWCLGCKDYEYEFLTSRFLHILLLRLAYTFPLPSEKYTKTQNLHEIEQNCSVWLNGISWNNEEGITTVVEVIQQKRWVVVSMYYDKDMTRPVEYSKHRSDVIRLVLELQKELAPDLDTFKCLISPALLQQWPLEHLYESDLFTIKNVAKCTLLKKPFVLSCDGSHKLLTKDAVPFEPYSILTPSSVCELIDNRMSDQPVSSALLNEVRKLCRQLQLESLSYLNLREYLDKMSIFTGRDPWVK